MLLRKSTLFIRFSWLDQGGRELFAKPLETAFAGGGVSNFAGNVILQQWIMEWNGHGQMNARSGHLGIVANIVAQDSLYN